MDALVTIFIAVAVLIILFFAYTTKSKLGKVVSFIILASIMLAQALTGFANLISEIEFLNFLEQIFRGIADIIVYIEVALIIFMTFFYKFSTKNIVLKVSIITYVVLILLVEFGVF